MTLLALKVLALSTMTIDHIGRFFFPEASWMTGIGRLAFPIFAWGIANGYRYTTDKRRYAIRVLIGAMISQIPYSLAFTQLGRSPFQLNILFTLLFGLLTIVVYQKVKHPIIRIIFVTGLALCGTISNMSYGWYGVLLPLIFYLTEKKLSKQCALFLITTVGYVFVNTVSATIHVGTGEIIYSNSQQIFSIFGLLFIWLYNNRPGLKLRYAFYVYYPVHLAILALIHYYLR